MTDLAVETEPPILAPGSEVAPGYSVLSLIRRGHRLDVYDVWNTTRRVRCVVKVVRPDRVTERHTQVYLRSEGELLCGLAHPHLVRGYEIVDHAGGLAVVLETLSGPTIEESLAPHRRLHPREVALLGAQLTSALWYLHDHGVLHRDLSAGNVILEGGTTKLIDLSLAGPPGPVKRGSGTAGYRSPEHTQGAFAGPAIDVWGAAAVLRRALVGRDLEDDPPTRRGLLASARVMPRTSLSREVGAVLDRSLVPEPEARPTMEQLHERLRELAED